MFNVIIGGHLNPAISLIMYTFGRLSFARFIIYSLAQTAGAFVGAAIAFLLYYGSTFSAVINIYLLCPYLFSVYFLINHF
jgi:glycerol uptake facilitator-like aquaporin